MRGAAPPTSAEVARGADSQRVKGAAAARLDALVALVADAARVLPALTASNAASERARLISALSRGESPNAEFVYAARKPYAQVFAALESARALAPESPAAALYLARLDELALELQLVESIGDARVVRPLAAQRYGTGAARVVALDGRESTVADAARAIVERTARVDAEPRTLPPDDARGGPSAARVVRALARAARVEVVVRIEPKLAAAAASGERTVLLAARPFGAREALRVAVHEVLGHLVSALNARLQPLRLLELGTAGSFGVQEGVALALEEQAGTLDEARQRTLAARVLATDRMHDGASFSECARWLVVELGLDAAGAIAVCERAYRGGGVARDASYLRGWLEVRRALTAGDATLDELRMGRVGIADLPELRALVAAGTLRESAAKPVTADVLARMFGA